MDPTSIAHVDGQNNVTVNLSRTMLDAHGIDPSRYEGLVQPTLSPSHYRIKVGAAGARFLGDSAGLGHDPRSWPVTLPDEIARSLVAALPHAGDRIKRMRAVGRRVPFAVNSNDLARAKGLDPSLTSGRYGASAESVQEYEQLVSDLKRQDLATEERAEQLADALLRLDEEWRPTSQWRATRYSAKRAASFSIPAAAVDQDARSTVRRRRRRQMTAAAKRFVTSADRVAALLENEIDIDWSAVVIGYCKATEVEAVARLLPPLCRELKNAAIPESDRADRAIKVAVNFCTNTKPPELGGLKFFLLAASTSRKRIQTSTVLQAFRRTAESWPGRNWILSADGAAAALEELTTRYRNPAAHTGELGYEDYASCRELVVGKGGLLRRLIDATDTTQ